MKRNQNENKRTKHHAIGEQASSKQQLISEIVNPEIDERRKRAISKSPKVREEDFVTDDMFPRAVIQFKKGADKEKYLERLKGNYGYIPTGQQMQALKLKK